MPWPSLAHCSRICSNTSDIRNQSVSHLQIYLVLSVLSKSSCPNDLDISRHFLSASVLKHFSNSCLVRFGIHFSATFPDKNLRRNLELSSEPVMKASVGSGTAQNMACLNIAGLTCKKANMAEVWFEWFGWCEWCGQRNARAGC